MDGTRFDYFTKSLASSSRRGVLKTAFAAVSGSALLSLSGRHAAAACTPALGVCSGGLECCSGSCFNNGSGNFCCAQVGDTCDQSNQCCGGSCAEGVCCGSDGDNCGTDNDCCSTGLCCNGQCCEGACLNNQLCCRPNELCFDTTDCCPGETCVIPQGEVTGNCAICASAGASCNEAAQCCSGCCQNGTCAEQPVCPVFQRTCDSCGGDRRG